VRGGTLSGTKVGSAMIIPDIQVRSRQKIDETRAFLQESAIPGIDVDIIAAARHQLLIAEESFRVGSYHGAMLAANEASSLLANRF
jgi:hypothetical protein